MINFCLFHRGKSTLLFQQQVLRVEREIATINLHLVDSEALTTFILRWDLALIRAHLFPESEEI